MKNQPMASVARLMFRYGFPPDFRGADAYLRELLEPAALQPPQGHRPLNDVLEEVVGSTLDQSTGERIVIPLSTGLDSRALLAATLRCAPKDRILCITWGSHPGAKEICETLGIEWQLVDRATFPFDSEAALGSIRDANQALGSYRGINEIVTQGVLSDFGRGNIWLSGYFGDAIAGKKLPATSLPLADAVNYFLNSQDITPPESKLHDENAIDFVSDLMKNWQGSLNQFNSLSHFDIAYFGLRQGLRIRGEPAWTQNMKFPFEHPAWVRWWLDKSYEDRSRPGAFLENLKLAYPNVFFLRKDIGASTEVKTPDWPRRFGNRLISALFSKRNKKQKNPHKHAEFLLHQDIYGYSGQILKTLDSRKLFPEIAFAPLIPSSAGALITKEAYVQVLSALRLELNLQAGTLKKLTSSSGI